MEIPVLALFVGCVLLIRPRSGKRGGRVPCSRFRPQRLDFHHTHFPKCNTEAPRFALRFWVAQRFQRCGSGANTDRLQPLREAVQLKPWTRGAVEYSSTATTNRFCAIYRKRGRSEMKVKKVGARSMLSAI